MFFDFNHLNKVGMTYWKHFVLGMQCNLYSLFAFVFGMIHTIFPFLFPFLPYEMIRKVEERIGKLYDEASSVVKKENI